VRGISYRRWRTSWYTELVGYTVVIVVKEPVSDYAMREHAA